jgi:ribosomal protein L25 (general stress protein Ctc)
MAQAQLKVWERDTTLTPRQLRAAGFIPATLYGKGIEPLSIQVRAHEFYQDYLHGKRNFQLTDFVNATAEIKSVQFDPVQRTPLSIQFHQR